ncbi:hypothetical protein Taro_030747 [Colocasia esculenta]|uniref:Protein kinase domain-containing protein n=1 Tax=Colocasia esculenta TaxID=4460 RepID=A0A843VSQ9_COLES|nr:hypothetical protein [Colocasia esculenta]
MGSGVHGWVRGRVLGRGATASVFLAARATNPAGAEMFAVKSAELSRSATLQREGRILSSLCSPHVVSCFGSDVTAEPDGFVVYNLFMEYVPGGTLSEAAKWCGGLDERRMRLYARGILGGLAYLHSAGVAHCDVKGQNVLLGEGGAYVKLADLGCARWVGGGDEDGGRWPIGGTPLYMAPEVARGEEQGTEADIWALGCTVIEMATGRLPWSDVADPVAAIHRICFSADVPDFPCNVSDAAQDFLGRCLKRDPRERWTAEQLLKHPFVNCTEEFAARRLPESKKISSPKSTLDQLFWDSWTEKEEEAEEERAQPLVEECHPQAQRHRLRQLASSSSSLIPPAADSTWCDDCWFTVRDGAEVGGLGVGPSVSPAAVCSKDDRIAVAIEEPSTGAAWSAGKRVDCCGGGEESAEGRGYCGVVTTVEDFLLPNPPCEHFISDNNPTRTCTSQFDEDEGDFSLAHAQICCNQIPKRLMLSITMMMTMIW